MAAKKKTEPQDDLQGIEGPGVAPVRIKELDQAIDAYVAERDKRMTMTKKEVAAKTKLSELMHKHEAEIGKDSNGEIIYRYNDEVAVLKPGKEELKVKTAPEVT